jgi:hypothetical protein
MKNHTVLSKPKHFWRMPQLISLAWMPYGQDEQCARLAVFKYASMTCGDGRNERPPEIDVQKDVPLGMFTTWWLVVVCSLAWSWWHVLASVCSHASDPHSGHFKKEGGGLDCPGMWGSLM